MGCCSSSTLSQVSTDAHCPPKRLEVGESPKHKDKDKEGSSEGRLRDQGSKGAQVVPLDDVAPEDRLPGCVPVPNGATAAPPSPIAAEPPPRDECEPAAPSSPAPAAGASQEGGKAAVVAAPADAAAGADAAPPPPTSWRLEPVRATASSIAAVFRRYAERIPPELARCLDCSWGLLETQGATSSGQADALQWMWLQDAEAPAEADGAEPLGLVVFRVTRGCSSSHGQIFHLSLCLPQWRAALPDVLRALCAEAFRTLPIAALRATLWYAEHDDGKYRLDTDVEAAYKQTGFRWFQLTNTREGKRGQIMARKRSTEAGDPPAPEDVLDIRVGACLFLPYVDRAALGVGSPTAAKTAMPRAPGNSLVMAECLRRHALLQREKLTGEVAQASPEPATATSSDALVQTLFDRLGRRGSLDIVKSTEACTAADCEAFATALLCGLGEPGQGFRVGLEPQVPPDAAGAGAGAAEGPRVLCGGLSLAVNWRAHRADPERASSICVPVHATGRAGEGAVAYLATEDEHVFVAVWPLPADLQSLAHEHDALYGHCSSVLKQAPPTETGEARAFAEVALPQFRLQAPAAASVPRSVGHASAFGEPRELLGARLALRRPPPGALQPEPAPAPAPAEQQPAEQPEGNGKVMNLDGPFVFCAWHAKVDDLEVPVFAVVVGPDDWVEH